MRKKNKKKTCGRLVYNTSVIIHITIRIYIKMHDLPFTGGVAANLEVLGGEYVNVLAPPSDQMQDNIKIYFLLEWDGILGNRLPEIFVALLQVILCHDIMVLDITLSRSLQLFYDCQEVFVGGFEHHIFQDISRVIFWSNGREMAIYTVSNVHHRSGLVPFIATCPGFQPERRQHRV